MPKNVLHDIMTKEQRSIREVPLPQGRRGGVPDQIEDPVLYEREEIEEETPPRGPSRFRRILLWGATFFLLFLLGFAFSVSFTGATLTVSPKTETVSIDHEFTASRLRAAKLRFEALEISETAELLIPADTEKKLSEKATGTIVIYNNFSDKPQRLIKNTRFETREGRIYRFGKPLTIPGKTGKGGSFVPGSIEAVVTADSPGAEYNIPLSDFTVPGFKGDTARYTGFYAKSKTPMTGGFEGVVKTPSDAALKTARASLQETLAKKVAAKREDLVPPGYILFDGAHILEGKSELPSEGQGGLSLVRESVTGAAYVFKRDDIAGVLASTVLPSVSGVPVEVPELGKLAFTLRDTPSGDPREANTLRFSLAGKANIVWLYDETKLKEALAGRQKSDLAAALSAFPAIEKVDLVIRPFWSKSVPKNPRKISVEKALPNPSPETP